MGAKASKIEGCLCCYPVSQAALFFTGEAMEINGKKYEATKFTLNNYPECVNALDKYLKSEDQVERRDLLITLFCHALGMDESVTRILEIDQALHLVNEIMLVNTMKVVPKVEGAEQA